MKALALPLFAALIAAPGAAAASDTCIRTAVIDGFKNATDRSIVITVRRDEYLVETTGTCLGLRDAIGVSVRAATSCLETGDSLIFNSNGMPQRCMISGISKVEKPAPDAPAAD